MQAQQSISKILTVIYSIVLSKASVSISYAIMGLSWLLLADFKTKWNKIVQYKQFIIPYLSIAILFLLGLLITNDFKYAWDNIRVKLPMFLMPLIVFSGPLIPLKHFRGVILFFILACFSASLIGYFKNWNALFEASFDRRKLSPFVSHIQLGQAISLSFLFVYYLLTQFKNRLKYLLLLPLMWFIFFATQAHSLTLLMGLMGVLFIACVVYIIKNNNLFGYSILLVFIFLGGYGGFKIKQVYNVVFIPKDTHVIYPTQSINGKPYLDLMGNERENGYLIGAQIQLEELKNEWMKRSNIPLDSTINNYALQFTLIRFLTSKGFSKDSLGVSNLTANEIQQIEKGVANVFYMQHKGFLARIHRTFWEIQALQNNYYESSSINLRFVFWQNGWQIFKNNFWFGVGTGDVKMAYQKIYTHENKYQLPPNNQLRAHQQFLTNYLTFGIWGGTIFLWAWLYQFKNIWNNSSKFIALGIFWVINAGMFYEDLLETLSAVALVCFSTVFWLQNYLYPKSSL